MSISQRRSIATFILLFSILGFFVFFPKRFESTSLFFISESSASKSKISSISIEIWHKKKLFRQRTEYFESVSGFTWELDLPRPEFSSFELLSRLKSIFSKNEFDWPNLEITLSVNCIHGGAKQLSHKALSSYFDADLKRIEVRLPGCTRSEG